MNMHAWAEELADEWMMEGNIAEKENRLIEAALYRKLAKKLIRETQKARKRLKSGQIS